MKIEIDGQEYTITDEVIQSAVNLLEKIALLAYDKVSSPLQMLLVGYARKDLYEREKAQPDKKDYFRPGKREDPAKHLMAIMKDEIVEMIKRQEFGIKTNANNEIVSFEFKNTSTGGGSLVVSGNEREWQDNSRKILG